MDNHVGDGNPVDDHVGDGNSIDNHVRDGQVEPTRSSTILMSDLTMGSNPEDLEYTLDVAAARVDEQSPAHSASNAQANTIVI